MTGPCQKSSLCPDDDDAEFRGRRQMRQEQVEIPRRATLQRLPKPNEQSVNEKTCWRKIKQPRRDNACIYYFFFGLAFVRRLDVPKTTTHQPHIATAVLPSPVSTPSPPMGEFQATREVTVVRPTITASAGHLEGEGGV